MLSAWVFGVVAVAPVGASAVDTEAARLSIERTLHRMERAVLAADSGGYMVLVDPSDPVFAEEERKFARDLRTRPVATVAFDLMPEGEITPGAQGGFVVPLVITWRLPGETEDRSVSFPAVFRPVGLPSGSWVFGGRVWETVPADGARLLVVAGDEAGRAMADHLAGRVGEILHAVETALDETLSVPPTIKIYPEMKELQASIALSYTDSLGGWNEPGESIKLLSREGMAGPRMEPVVAHELGHAVSFEYGPEVTNAPWWSLEGIAEVAADGFREERPDAARGLAKDGKLMPFSSLADFRGEAMNHGRQVYVQGRSMVAYIGRRFGHGARHEWFRVMGRGESVDAASRAALGIGFDQLEAEWRASLAE